MSYVVLCTALLLTLFRIGKEAAALLPVLFPVKCSTFSVFSLEIHLLTGRCLVLRVDTARISMNEKKGFIQGFFFKTIFLPLDKMLFEEVLGLCDCFDVLG